MDVKKAESANKHLTPDKLKFLQSQAKDSHDRVGKHIRALVASLRQETEVAASALTELNDKVLCELLEECKGYERIDSLFQAEEDMVIQYELEITNRLNALAALLSSSARPAKDVAQNKHQHQHGISTTMNIAIGTKVWDADSYVSPIKQLPQDIYCMPHHKRPRLHESFDVEVEDASSEEDWEEERVSPGDDKEAEERKVDIDTDDP